MTLPKKVSWILLTTYFTFDAVVSYWGITKMGGREANLVIAPYVEKYPLLYFLCIPLELLGGYIIVRILQKWIDERIVLTGAAIYWPIANSSLNLLFLLGFRHMGYLWSYLIVSGIVAAVAYATFTLKSNGR